MMPIDFTAQFAPIFEGMVLVLIVAAAGLAFAAVRGAVSQRRLAARPQRNWGADAKPVRA